ncbi:MAG: serine/threonine protein kinase [Myxococcales bacterium]|nr:serine/threonine protein kinase [Myxococcales bacterium]
MARLEAKDDGARGTAVATPSAETLAEDERSGPSERRRAALSTTRRRPPDADSDADADSDDDELDEAEMPGRLGRFTLVRRLGAGAMGVVYSAYDELLDRRVAIKVLRGERGAAAQARMLREAQALARLSHPHVVQVYDVGEQGGRLFVAMEYVHGCTLREWLTARRAAGRGPELRELVAIFAQAGEGLAAAHEAGLTHRDFKPENVLVGEDGRARVVDFGLASAGVRKGDEALPRPLLSAEGVLTRTGTILGTPAYMAPEQLIGADADARSDIFAFCVALLEAIAGTRPVSGRSIDELLAAIHEGAPREATSVAPPWLRQVIERGLAADPDARYPSMRALLDALARDPGRRRRRWLAVGGIAACVGAALIGTGVASESRARRCEARGDAILAAWDDDARERVRGAFAASGVAHARDTTTRVIDRLDTWTGAWRSARVDLCAAEERGDRLAVAEATCLEGHLWRLRALVDALARADAGAVNRAVSAVSELPPVERCHDLGWLRVGAAADLEAEARTADAREELARARVQISAGAFTDAEATLAPLLDAREPAIKAEAWMLAGVVDRQLGELSRAIERLEEAYFLAGESGADLVAAEAAVLTMAAIGASRSRHEEGLAWGRSAAMMVGRVDLGERELGARYLITLGVIERQRGDFDAALAAYERALAIFRADLGPRHPSVARALNNIGNALTEKGDLEAAAARLREALAIFEEIYGPEHPDMAIFLGNLGAVLTELDRRDEARALTERALAVSLANLGPEHPQVADARVNLAFAAVDVGDFAGALAELDQARAILRAQPPSRELAYAEQVRVRALQGLGRVDEALAAASEAEALARDLEVPALLPQLHFLKAQLLWGRGDHAEARALALAAKELYAIDPSEGAAGEEVARWLADHPPPSDEGSPDR